MKLVDWLKPEIIEDLDMPLKSIGNNLIIKHGEIQCKDGTDLQIYLSKFFKEGQEINVIDHATLVELNNSVGYNACA